MNKEDIDALNNLFYKAEDFQHYNVTEYNEYYKYVNSINENISSIDDEELKKRIVNWTYKNKVYKTLNVNSITIPYTLNMAANVLYGLLIRAYTRQDYNSFPLTLHIEYDDRKYGELYREVFERLEPVTKIFDKVKIHFYNNKCFGGEMYEYIANNEYEIIHEIESLDDIIETKDNIHLYVTDDIITDIESYFKKAKECKCEKFYVTCCCEDSNNRNIFRKNIDDYVLKYTDLKFSIIIEDYLPGQHLYVDDVNVQLKTNHNAECINKDMSIFSIIEQLKLQMIETMYLSDECLNCNEKILCMLGVSDKDCAYKIL